MSEINMCKNDKIDIFAQTAYKISSYRGMKLNFVSSEECNFICCLMDMFNIDYICTKKTIFVRGTLYDFAHAIGMLSGHSFSHCNKVILSEFDKIDNLLPNRNAIENKEVKK